MINSAQCFPFITVLPTEMSFTFDKLIQFQLYKTIRIMEQTHCGGTTGKSGEMNGGVACHHSGQFPQYTSEKYSRLSHPRRSST